MHSVFFNCWEKVRTILSYVCICLCHLQDFGDYSENFYSVQTNEGEKISQLIAMYIDIIMQKKRPLNTDVPEDEDEPVIVESDIDSQKLVIWCLSCMSL